MMLVEMFSKIFFRNDIYWDVFENLTFRKFPAIRYMRPQKSRARISVSAIAVRGEPIPIWLFRADIWVFR